jgi:exodeoxyribonuclease VII large subunit
VENSLTVRQLCDVVDQTITALFPDELWVRGAISGIKRSANGHVYFDLIDPDDQQGSAVLPVALFANNKHRVNAILKKSGGSVKMTDGIEIQIRGRLTYYPRQSRLQLLMSLIDPAFTLGQMTANRDRVLAALQADGLLDRNRRLPRPVLPLRLVLITSAGSAAAADFLHELDASSHPFEVITIDARVQGDDAVRSITDALAEAQDLAVDAIALVRGGGARTDLVAFDHELVARAIAASSLPVIVGIGHEIDRSIADEVAHAAAKTPTACARFFIDAADHFRARVEAAAAGIDRSSHRILTAASTSLAEARGRLGRSAIRTVEREAMRIELIQDGVARSSARMLERSTNELDTIAIRLADLDPATTMARGWSITRDPEGRVIRSIDDVTPGDQLTTTLADGTVRSTVDELIDRSGGHHG